MLQNKKYGPDWELIWARKFHRDLNRLNMTGRGYTDIIREFIRENPGNPSKIDTSRLEKFIIRHKKNINSQLIVREALMVFYRETVKSPIHVEILAKGTDRSPDEMITDSAQKEAHVQDAVIFTDPKVIKSIENIDDKPEQRTDAVNGMVFFDDQQSQMLSESTESYCEKLKRSLKARGKSTRTIENYSKGVREYLDWLSRKPTDKDGEKFEQYSLFLLEKKHLSPNTINLINSSLIYFYRYIVGWDEVKKSIVRVKSGKPLPGVYSEEEVARILEAPSSMKHQLILKLAYGCGLRLSEIRNLRKQDINFGRDVIIIREGKGKKDRSVMFDIELKRELKIYFDIYKCTEYVFEGYNPGVPLSIRTIEKVYENACKKAGIRIVGGIHALRHSFATHLLENGVDLRYIQELLGHSRSTTTEIYTHVSSNKIGKIRSPLAYLREKKRQGME